MAEPSARLADLEQRFEALGPELPEGPQKQALSLLHAMILETRRAQAGGGATSSANLPAPLVAPPPMEGAAESQGLPVGGVAPAFTLPDANGRPVSLADYRGHRVLLVFYPLDWSPTCSDQLSLYQADLPEFERLKTKLLGISVDSVYSHGAWAAARGLTFPLLADFNPRGEVARRYQVLRASDGFSERALYLVDGAGVIRYAHVAPELHKAPDIYALFEQLEALAGG